MSRKRMIWYGAALVGIIALIYITIGVVYVIGASGMLASFKPHFAGTCQKVSGIVGAEDIVMDAQGIAWLSGTDRRKVIAGEKVRGQIATLDLKKRKPTLRDITPTSPSNFQPLGISLFTAQDGQRFLFAINRANPKAHTIERFLITKTGRLRHNGSFRSPAMFSPNNLVVVGKDQFYASNDLGSDPDGIWRLPELLFGLAWGSLAFFDGKQGKIIVEDLSFPNGLAKSKDGKKIYLAELAANKIIVFDRDPATNKLTHNKDIPMPSRIDNITIDEFGDIWAAGHPKLFSFQPHADDPKNKAPSLVFIVSPKTDAVDEIYYEEGETISAATTAAPYKNRFVLGPLFDPDVLVCDR